MAETKKAKWVQLIRFACGHTRTQVVPQFSKPIVLNRVLCAKCRSKKK